MPDNPYVRGPTYARNRHPTFEFKPSATGYTGGGYARIRSTEYRDHTPGDGSDDVFVSTHRLAAVAWHLPDGTLGEDVHLADLDGMDVHHTTGMPAANGPTITEVDTHASHSATTQAQVRAWGADAKRSASDGPSDTDPDRCVRCGDAYDLGHRSDDWDGVACHDCARDLSDGSPIEVV